MNEVIKTIGLTEMNRRSFVKGLFLSLGAIFIAPEILIPKEEPNFEVWTPQAGTKRGSIVTVGYTCRTKFESCTVYAPFIPSIKD
jgi:hypothetical protein